MEDHLWNLDPIAIDDDDPDYEGHEEDGDASSDHEVLLREGHHTDDSEVHSAELGDEPDEPVFLDRVTFHHPTAGGPFIRFLADLFDQTVPQTDHLPGVAPAEIPVLRVLRRNRADLDEYVQSTKKYFASTLEMLNQVDTFIATPDPRLPAEIRSGLEERKVSQAELHASMSMFLDAIAKERTGIQRLMDAIRPSTLEAFNNKWIPLIEDPSRKLTLQGKTAPMACIICTDNVANAVIRRSCAHNDLHFNCEGQACSCDAIMCVSCLVHHFWNQSEEGAKSYARCPHCRAEYCPMDVRLVEVETGATTRAQQVASSELSDRPSKRARGARRQQQQQQRPPPAAATTTRTTSMKRSNRRR